VNWILIRGGVKVPNIIARFPCSRQLSIPISGFVKRTHVLSLCFVVFKLNGFNVYAGSLAEKFSFVTLLKHHSFHVPAAALEEESVDYDPMLWFKFNILF